MRLQLQREMLMVKKFHLGWFTNFAVDEWLNPLSSAGGAPWSGDIYVDLAKSLERACFDYMILEDTLMVSDVYGGDMGRYVKNAIHAPKHDPAPLAAVIASHTTRLGIVSFGAPLRHHRSYFQRPVRLEHRHKRRRCGRAKLRSGQDHRARCPI